MASSTTIDVDAEYEIDKEDGGMDTLDFRDIPHSSGDPEKGKTHEFTNFPHSAVDSDDDAEEDTSKLLKEEKAASTSSFWTFSYYQQFFNVETKQVGLRILGSMVPKPGSNYLLKEIRPNPDLYGPFWICTTLVFTTAIAGNLANYFSSAGKDYHWRYDFHKVTFAATAIFSYWWLIPLALFGLMWCRGYKDRFSFLEMICVYGYSLAIYIPISVLWAIQVAWLQWLLVVLGAVLSGSVLLLTFWPTVSEGNKKIAIGVMIFIFVMHAALAAGFVLYFFHVPVAPASQPNSTPKTIVTPQPHVNTKPSVNSKKLQQSVQPNADNNNKKNDKINNIGNNIVSNPGTPKRESKAAVNTKLDNNIAPVVNSLQKPHAPQGSQSTGNNLQGNDIFAQGGSQPNLAQKKKKEFPNPPFNPSIDKGSHIAPKRRLRKQLPHNANSHEQRE